MDGNPALAVRQSSLGARLRGSSCFAAEVESEIGVLNFDDRAMIVEGGWG